MSTNSDRQAQARRYVRRVHVLAILGFVIGLAYLVAMFAGLTGVLASGIARLTDSRLLVVALFAAAFTVGYTVLVFPIRVYRGFVLERKFGLSLQSFWTWLVDEVKSIILSTLMVVVLAQIVYALLYAQPTYWWIWAGVVWFLLTVVISRLAPVLLVPLFYKQKALSDPELVRRIQELLQGTAFRVKGVYVFNLSRTSNKATAFLIGLGWSRRVLLADTLLSNMNHDEIVAVVAHELGHHVYGHIGKLLLWSGFMSFVSFYAAHRALTYAVGAYGYTSVSDVRTFPLLMAVFIGVILIVRPLQAYFSRILERNADTYSGRHTGHPEHLVAALEKLAQMNLVQRKPSKLFYLLSHDHPTVEQRIARLRRLARVLAQSPEGGPS